MAKAKPKDKPLPKSEPEMVQADHVVTCSEEVKAEVEVSISGHDHNADLAKHPKFAKYKSTGDI